MIDAFKRASAGRITAVVPVLRVRPVGQEGPAAGAHHGAPHRGHDQRRGRRPAAHDGPPPGPDPGLLQHPRRRADRGPPAVRTTSSSKQLENPVVVTDLGFAKRARTFAELIDAPLAIIEKRRTDNDDRAEVLNVIGEVRGKRAIIVDDEIDTAGTLMRDHPRAGARGRRSRCTPAPRTACCPARPSSASASRCCARSSSRTPSRCRRPHQLSKIKQLSVAPLIGEAISAHPPRRVGGRAVLVGDPARPGDGPLGSETRTVPTAPAAEPIGDRRSLRADPRARADRARVGARTMSQDAGPC